MSDGSLDCGALPFCDGWDRRLAEDGALALFLRDADGELRLSADRTRDALRHASGPFPTALTVALLRDVATGHTHLAVATSPGLLEGHPRLQATVVETYEEALAALGALGPTRVQTRSQQQAQASRPA